MHGKSFNNDTALKISADFREKGISVLLFLFFFLLELNKKTEHKTQAVLPDSATCGFAPQKITFGHTAETVWRRIVIRLPLAVL